MSRTGEDVAAWNQRIADAGLGDEQALRAWLAGRGVTRYAPRRPANPGCAGLAWSVERAP